MMTVLEKTELNIQYFTGINFWAEIRTQIEDFVAAFLMKKPFSIQMQLGKQSKKINSGYNEFGTISF